MDIRDTIVESYPDTEFIFFDGFDEALLGVVERFNDHPVTLYDEEHCIEILVEDQGMEHEEALEYFDYNVKGAYLGKSTPAFVTLLK